MVKKISVLIAFFLLMFSACLVYAWEGGRIGDPCPQIMLNNVQTGQMTNLNELSKGKVTAIIFPRFGSSFSRKNLENLKNLLDIMPDLCVIVVWVEGGSTARIQKYIDHYQFNKFPFTFLHDPTFSAPQKFGLSWTPSIVILDKSGTVRYIRNNFIITGFDKQK